MSERGFASVNCDRPPGRSPSTADEWIPDSSGSTQSRRETPVGRRVIGHEDPQCTPRGRSRGTLILVKDKEKRGPGRR